MVTYRILMRALDGVQHAASELLPEEVVRNSFRHEGYEALFQNPLRRGRERVPDLSAIEFLEQYPDPATAYPVKVQAGVRAFLAGYDVDQMRPNGTQTNIFDARYRSGLTARVLKEVALGLVVPTQGFVDVRRPKTTINDF